MTDLEKEFKRLEERGTEIEKSVEDLEKQVNFYKKVAWTFIIIGFGLAILGIIKMFVPIDDNELSKLGNIGDYVSGTTGAAWSLAGLVLVYVAFLGQKQQLLQQQLEILYNQMELKATRFELQGQKKEMQEQNETLRLQKFENTFFQLLSSFNRLTSEINNKNNDSHFTFVKSNVLEIYNNLTRMFQNRGAYLDVSDEVTTFGNLKTSFEKVEFVIEKVYSSQLNKIGNYFRVLYGIISFVNDSNLTDEDKYKYIKFIRAQLSNDELFIIFYNCITKRGAKFKPLVEKYHIFNNLPLDSLINKEDNIKYYEIRAYGKNLLEYPLNDENLDD